MTIDEKLNDFPCGNCVHYETCAYKDYRKICNEAMIVTMNDLEFFDSIKKIFHPIGVLCKHHLPNKINLRKTTRS